MIALSDIIQSHLQQFSLIFIRIGSAVFLLPLFGERIVPVRVRLAIALSFSAILYPVLMQNESLLQRHLNFAVSGLREVVIGLIIGLLLRLHVFAIQIAASIAAQTTSLAQLFGNESIDPQPAIGLVFYFAALATAASMDVHVLMVMFFLQTYEIFPLFGTSFTITASSIVSAIGNAFKFGFILSASFVAASLLYNLALGVINRAMPYLMVAFVGAPVITYASLLLVMFCLPIILTIWAVEFKALLDNPLQAR